MYISLNDLKNAFTDGDIILDENGEVDTARIDVVIARTSNLIDSYLRAAQINTPVTDTAVIEIIKGPALDIARYEMWADHPTEAMVKRNEQAIAWLKDVSKGNVRIVTEKTESRKSGFHTIRINRA